MSISIRENPAVWIAGAVGALGVLAIYLSQNPGVWDEIFGGVLNNNIEVTPEAKVQLQGAKILYEEAFYDFDNGPCPGTNGGPHIGVSEDSHFLKALSGPDACVACGKPLEK